MTRARVVRNALSCSLAIAVSRAAPRGLRRSGSAVPDVSIRPAGVQRFVERSAGEQQAGLGVTFFVRVENTGNATGSFLVEGDHGGAVFTVRYLAGGTVLAPVTGKVIRVTRYELYCGWHDLRVAIRPSAAPERTVQIFHVADPRVERGDHALVSHTVIGRARLFPFRSETQDHGLSARHVHLEIERDGSAPLPGCGLSARADDSWSDA